MKIRMRSEVKEEGIGSSGLTGKPLVIQSDDVGYVCYDVELKAGTQCTITSG